MKTILIFLTTMILSINCFAGEAIWADVRTQQEYQADHIKGDVNIPLSVIDSYIFEFTSDKDTQINLYCRSGRRAEAAKQKLEKLGFKNVRNYKTAANARAARK